VGDTSVLEKLGGTGINQEKKAEEACRRMSIHDDYILTDTLDKMRATIVSSRTRE